ncbi:uncharacterized protein VK521_008611 isoform 1-T1 [Ammospiza maritima maritima]
MPFVRHLNEVQRIISPQLEIFTKWIVPLNQGLSDAKENPRPLLLAPVKRFGLLGCSSYQPAEWPQLGGTPALLPPAIRVKPLQHQWGAKKTLTALRMWKSCNHHHTLCHL